MKKILTFTKFKTLNLLSTNELVSLLSVDLNQFKKLTQIAETEYTPILKLKKNKIDFRTIHAPSQKLKEIQFLIYEKILHGVILPPCVFGHSRGKSIIENAQYHSKSTWLLNVDLINFFPSIRYPSVQKLFEELTCSKKNSTELTKLVTYKGVLPQGSPASPYLSALILNNLDARLFGFCKNKGLRYTRYFDDITISGTKSFFGYEEKIFEIIESEGYLLHRAGEKISRFIPGETKTVTGIEILSNGKLSFGDPDELERYVEDLKVKGVECSLSENLLKEKQVLQGKIAFLSQVIPDRGQKIKKTFDMIDWKI